MGNALGFLCGCYKKTPKLRNSYSYAFSLEEDESLGPHGVTANTTGVSALAHDVFHFNRTSQVPEGLSEHVDSSKRVQANWYRKLVKAWTESKPPPRTPEEAARLVFQTLRNEQNAEIEALLSFYDLYFPEILLEPTAEAPPSLPEGVKYVLDTLPVHPKAVVDGDGINVYVSTEDPRESSRIPLEVQEAAFKRRQALAERNKKMAKALHRQIIKAGYGVLNEVLARKYRIRLKGIDAPENGMEFGEEARQELANLVGGKSLRVLVYGEDQYERLLGDVYCNGRFIQKLMLQKGLAWHYKAYDKRPELAKWENEARTRREGLWAASNPEKPWEWRRARRQRR